MARRPVVVLAAVLGTGAAAGIGALAYQLSHGDQAKEAPAGPTASAKARKLPSFGPQRAPGCLMLPGQALAYAFDVRTSGQAHPERLNLPPGTRLEGTSPSRTTAAKLDLRVLRNEGDAAVLLARFGTVDPETIREVGAEVADAPFLLKVNERCKIVGYARLDTTGRVPARTQQGLAHELQWTWPASDKATDDGESAFGAYTATYTASAGRAPVIERRIDVYTKVWERATGFGLAATDKPATSYMRVVPGLSPWFESLSGREKLVGMSVVDTDTTTEISSRPPSPEILADAPTDEARYVWESTFTKPVGRVAKRMDGPEHRARVEQMRGLKLPAALDKMYEAINADANIARVWPLMEAYLEAHPDEAQRVVDMLKNGEIAEGAVAATFIALGKTPTPQAKEALWGLKDDRAAGVLLRTSSAFALVDRDDVDVSLARSLLADAGAINKGATRAERLYSREAALALGMLSGLKAEDDEIKKVATGGALAILKAGTDARSLSPGLNALANIGDPALLPHVLPYTKNSDPKVREAAAKVIRRMPPLETATATAEWLERENDPFVKRALYGTLTAQLADAQQPPDDRLVAQAIRDLDKQPSTLTRQSLIHLLGAVAGQNRPARAALIKQVKHEHDDETGLLKQLGQYLSAEDIARGMVM